MNPLIVLFLFFVAVYTAIGSYCPVKVALGFPDKYCSMVKL